MTMVDADLFFNYNLDEVLFFNYNLDKVDAGNDNCLFESDIHGLVLFFNCLVL